jgi:endonuclease I
MRACKLRNRRIHLAVLLVFFVTFLVHSQTLPPFTYYSSATNLTSSALEAALHNIIKGHTVIGYTPTHESLCVLDRDPANSGNVILIYSGYSVDTNTWPSWNREHLYPESFGTSSGTQHSDLFNLRACSESVNSSRGNKYYDVSTGTITYPANAPGTSYDGDSWEPRDIDKGFVARGCFYMSTRYDGTGGDSNLQLADSPNASASIFAKLSTLLAWNRQFPPSDWERGRNGQIYQLYQHNRNPFIDNPDFADMLFLGVDGFAAWENDHFSTAELSNAAVSAELADPDGDGLPNLAEYVFGHNPHSNDMAVIQSLTNGVDGGTNYLYIAHHVNHYLSGVTLTYQVSTDMVAWADVTPEVITNMQIDAQKDLVSVRFPASGPMEFVRFKLHRLSDLPPGAGVLDVSPLGNFVSSGNGGGPFTPGSLIYTLSNTGISNLNWTASETVNWLDLSATSGSLAPNGNTQVTVSINANADSLAPGIYSDTVFFNNTSTGEGNTTRSVTLTVINQAPVILASGSALVSESCSPGNGAIDPGETVTVNLSLNNVGTGNTSNLVATLVASDSVISPSSPQTYGVVVAGGASVTEPFTFTAAGTCGSVLSATLELQDGPTDLGTISYNFTLGAVTNPVAENFDEVTVPSLPVSWATSATGGESNWVTATTAASTAPNAAFSPDVGVAGVNELDSPPFLVLSAAAQLTFAQNYSLSVSATNPLLGYSGGVLEISIGGGGYQDIVAAGGSFVSGGYNATLSSDYANPLAGQAAWSGNSGGFVSTTVNLPASAAAQTVQLRWRCATGSTPSIGYSGTLAGWDVSGQTGYGTSPLAASTTGASLTVGGLTRGSGVGTSGSAALRAWGGTGWIDTSSTNAIAANRFATLTIQANPGASVSFSSISKFDYRRSNTGPPNGLLQYQVGSADTFHDIGTVSYSSTSSSGASLGPIGLSTYSALQNVAAGTVVTFRIVNWGGSGSTGTWYIFDKAVSTASDFEIQGSVVGGGAPGAGWYVDSISVNDSTCCTGP